MKKIGIIICNRYGSCGGGKCFRAIRERTGGFSIYPEGEELEVVGYSNCGGCPGGNVEYVPAEMKRNGAEAIHLATGLIVGYPPCPNIERFKEYIETVHGMPVIVGTHPIPMKYLEAHRNLPFWKQRDMERIAGDMISEDPEIMKAYD